MFRAEARPLMQQVQEVRPKISKAEKRPPKRGGLFSA